MHTSGDSPQRQQRYLARLSTELERLAEARERLSSSLDKLLDTGANRVEGVTDARRATWDITSPPDLQKAQSWQLTRLQICQQLGLATGPDTAAARVLGCTWTQIGAARGVTPQAAQAFWVRFTNNTASPSEPPPPEEN